MKMNVDGEPRLPGEYMNLETLIERGRQLQSKAVFEMCANIFTRKNISTAKFKIEERDPRFIESH
jgi:hypothetical protein